MVATACVDKRRRYPLGEKRRTMLPTIRLSSDNIQTTTKHRKRSDTLQHTLSCTQRFTQDARNHSKARLTAMKEHLDHHHENASARHTNAWVRASQFVPTVVNRKARAVTISLKARCVSCAAARGRSTTRCHYVNPASLAQSKSGTNFALFRYSQCPLESGFSQ